MNYTQEQLESALKYADVGLAIECDCVILAAEVRRLQSERDMWKANHDNQVELKRILTDRPDLGDRAASMQKLRADLAAANERAEKAAREGIAHYKRANLAEADLARCTAGGLLDVHAICDQRDKFEAALAARDATIARLESEIATAREYGDSWMKEAANAQAAIAEMMAQEATAKRAEKTA